MFDDAFGDAVSLFLPKYTVQEPVRAENGQLFMWFIYVGRTYVISIRQRGEGMKRGGCATSNVPEQHRAE